MASGGSILIELGWPAKALSPNAREHFMVVSRYRKAAKVEAGWATKIARPLDWGHDGPFEIGITAYPPKNWATADKDNFVARMKSHLDGIAEALGVNDKTFQAPTLKWADKTERGKVVITVKPA